MGMPSVPQLLIILVIVVLIFGAKRLKNLGGDLGSAVKGFKEAVKDESKTDENQTTAELADGSHKTQESVQEPVMHKTDDQKNT